MMLFERNLVCGNKRELILASRAGNPKLCTIKVLDKYSSRAIPWLKIHKFNAKSISPAKSAGQSTI